MHKITIIHDVISNQTSYQNKRDIYFKQTKKTFTQKKKKVHKTEPVKTENRKKISLEKPEIISIQIRFVSKHSD